jgi:hypothetical protein
VEGTVKNSIILSAAVVLASSAAAQPGDLRGNETASRGSARVVRVRYEAGRPVELLSLDRASRVVRVGIGDSERTLAVVRDPDAAFDALGAGGPLLLSWRFNRSAEPEAVIRVLTEDGPVTVVATVLD